MTATMAFANDIIKEVRTTLRTGRMGQCIVKKEGSNGKPRLGPFSVNCVTFTSFENIGVVVEDTIASPHYEGRYQITDVRAFCRNVARLTRNVITMQGMENILKQTKDRHPELYFNERAGIVVSENVCLTLHLEIH